MVSTCVGEEGLDIGEVDLIICYDTQKSPIRLIQRMGRTGRKREGRIIILLTEGKEEQSYKTSLAKKKNIYKIIANGSKNFRFYQHNPLMVPQNLKPTCHKLFIAAPTDELVAVKKNKKSKKTETDGEESPEVVANKSKRVSKKSLPKDDKTKPTKSRKKANKVESSLTDESPEVPQKTKNKFTKKKQSNSSTEHDSIGPTQLPDLDFDLDGNGQMPQSDKSDQVMMLDEDSKTSFPSDIIVDETVEQNYSPLLNESSLSPIVTKRPQTQQFSFSPLMSQKPSEKMVGSLLDRIDSLTAANKMNKTQTDLDELFADEDVEKSPIKFNKHETNLNELYKDEEEISRVEFQKPQTDLDELFADEEEEEEKIIRSKINELYEDEEEKEINPVKFEKPQTDLDELFADEEEEEKNNVKIETSPVKFAKYETSVNELFADEEIQIPVKFEKHPTDLNDLFGDDEEDEASPVKFEKHPTDLNELFGDEEDDDLQCPVKFEKHATDLNELFADEDEEVEEKSEKNPIKFSKFDTNLAELFDDDEVVQTSPIEFKKYHTDLDEMFEDDECVNHASPAKFQTFPTNVDEIFADDEDEHESKTNYDLIVNDTVASDESRSNEQCVKDTVQGILKSTSTPMDLFKKKRFVTGNTSLRKQLLIRDSPLILSQLNKPASCQTQIGLTQALDLLLTNSGCSTPADHCPESAKIESDEPIVVEEVNNDLDSLICLDNVSAPTSHSRKRKLRFDESSIAECSFVAAKAATKARIQASIINVSNEADVDDDDESIIVKKPTKLKSNFSSSLEEHSGIKQSRNSADISDYNEVIGNNVNQSTTSSGSSASERRYLKKFAANHTNTSEELSSESALISVETKKVLFISFQFRVLTMYCKFFICRKKQFQNFCCLKQLYQEMSTAEMKMKMKTSMTCLTALWIPNPTATMVF